MNEESRRCNAVDSENQRVYAELSKILFGF